MHDDNEHVTVVMQIYDFLYHVVFQYIFLLSIQLCCYHTVPRKDLIQFDHVSSYPSIFKSRYLQSGHRLIA